MWITMIGNRDSVAGGSLRVGLWICGLLVSFGFASAASPTWVHMRLHADERAAARRFAREFGDSLRFDPKSHEFSFRLRSGRDVQETLDKLDRHREVDEAWADGVTRRKLSDDMRSVEGIEARIDEIKRRAGVDPDEEEHRPRKKGSKESEEEAGTDYLESLKEFTELRAYPYSRIDWSAYDTAVEYAKTMHAATGPASAGGVGKTGVNGAAGLKAATATQTVPMWQYVGPKNLATYGLFYNGPGPVSGRVNAVAVDPNNANNIYVGAGQGGVWKSADGGVTWAPLSDAWKYLSVSTITIDPTNSNNIYVGTGDYQGELAYCFGIMKSTDGGQTWTNYGLSSFGTTAVSALVVDPDNPSIITASAGRGAGTGGYLWRSTNGGVTWAKAINTYGPWDCVCCGLSNGINRIYYAVLGGASAAIYTSVNQGQTWTKLTTAPFQHPGANYQGDYLAASAVDPNTVYFLDGYDNAIWKSLDAGITWTNTTNNFPQWPQLFGSQTYNWYQWWYDYYIYALPNNGTDDLIVGLVDIDESQDGGATWQSIGNTPSYSAVTHNDQHGFSASASNPNMFVFGNDGGAYQAVRNGTGWTVSNLNQGLGITMFYNVQWHPTDPTQILGGSQDNGSPFTMGNLNNWKSEVGGDGFWCAIKPDNPQIQAATYTDLDLYVTQNNWQDGGFEYDASPPASEETNNSRIFQDPVNTRYLYGCTDYLWRFDYTTLSWTADLNHQMLTKSSVKRIMTVAVAPANGNVIYTGSNDGNLEMSTNAAGSFSVLTNSATALPNRGISMISVDPSNPYTILVGYSGTGSNHLYLVQGTNTATPTYSTADGIPGWTLPNIPLDCIERDPNYPNTWYVGTDIGLFRTTNAGLQWANMTAPRGLPNVQVVSIKANAATGILGCATYGRGIWQMLLGTTYTLSPNQLLIDQGTLQLGNIGSLVNAGDGNVVYVLSAMEKNQPQTATLETDFSVPLTNGMPVRLTLTVDSAAASNDTEYVYIFDYKTNAWVVASSFAANNNLALKTVQVSGTAADYVRASDGNIKTKVEFVRVGNNQQAFQAKVDQIQLRAQTSY